jgi:hypothetical protein
MDEMGRMPTGEDIIARLARRDWDEQIEKYRVSSPGARTAAWVIKVISCSSYNVYNVQIVQLAAPGTVPGVMGAEMQAVNVAEPFLQTGQLPAGSYAIMFRAGDKNVFYAPV